VTMNFLPRISIVTTVRNGLLTIERTIQSVLKQSYNNIQYIIIDGGSTDGTIEIIKKYENRIDVWISELDGGIYDGFNKGISRADGQYVCIINSDDFLYPNTIERLVENIPRQSFEKEFPIIHANISLIMKSGQEISVYRHNHNAIKDRYYSMPVNHPATFVPLSVYEQIGNYDSSFRIAGDYDFILRAFRCGIKFLHIDETLVCMQTGGASSLRNAYTLSRERFQARVRNGGGVLFSSLLLFGDYLQFSLRKLKRVFVKSKYEDS